MKSEENLEGVQREWTDHPVTESERVDRKSKYFRFDADSRSELDESMSANDSEYSTAAGDDGSFSTVSSWTTFTLPMERENQESYMFCGLDLVASAKEGLDEISDMFFKTLSNALRAGNDKKTKLTNTVKSKMNERMDRERQEEMIRR